MIIQDIIGTKISTKYNSVYEIVQGDSPFIFALKDPSGHIYYNKNTYSIEYFLHQVGTDGWKVIEEPKQIQMSKQYITTKDLPDIAVGTVSYSEARYNYYFKGKNTDQVAYLKEIVETSDFFKEYIAPFNPKVGDYLYCHTSLITSDTCKEEATKGKIYKCKENGCFQANSDYSYYMCGQANDYFRLATEEEIKAYEDTKREIKIIVGNPATEITINRLGWVTGSVRGYNLFAISINSLIEIVDYFKILTIGPIQGYSTTIQDVSFHIGCDEGIDVSLTVIKKIVETYNALKS